MPTEDQYTPIRSLGVQLQPKEPCATSTFFGGGSMPPKIITRRSGRRGFTFKPKEPCATSTFSGGGSKPTEDQYTPIRSSGVQLQSKEPCATSTSFGSSKPTEDQYTPTRVKQEEQHEAQKTGKQHDEGMSKIRPRGSWQQTGLEVRSASYEARSTARTRRCSLRKHICATPSAQWMQARKPGEITSDRIGNIVADLGLISVLNR